MTEKRQTSQGYIIRILQHFATKLRNITNFVMLFQAVMKFLSRLVEIKISLKRGKVYYDLFILRGKFFQCRVFAMKSVQNLKYFRRSSQNYFVLALFSSL